MTIQILGAGMAGLLTAEMLRRQQPVVLEAQSALPDNHGALLRFRSEAVQRETGQPFRKVRVLKAIKRSREPLRTTVTLADSNLYAAKVSGTVMERSILNLDPSERYIAPDDFLANLAKGATVQLDRPFTHADLQSLAGQREVATLSTIPMPVLMKIAGWPVEPGQFPYRPIWSVTMRMDYMPVNVYQTIYYPDLEVPYYRASVTGNQLIVEYYSEPLNALADMAFIAWDFGIPTWDAGHQPVIKVKRQEYGKLMPVDSQLRHEFIMAMTDQFNIYSIGRFATWRQILLDDVVHDIHVVNRLITNRSDYMRHLHGRGR